MRHMRGSGRCSSHAATRPSSKQASLLNSGIADVQPAITCISSSNSSNSIARSPKQLLPPPQSSPSLHKHRPLDVAWQQLQRLIHIRHIGHPAKQLHAERDAAVRRRICCRGAKRAASCEGKVAWGQAAAQAAASKRRRMATSGGALSGCTMMDWASSSSSSTHIVQLHLTPSAADTHLARRRRRRGRAAAAP